MSDFQTHQQLVLRLPETLATKINQDMAENTEMNPVEVKPQEDIAPVFFQFHYKNNAFPALLINMPCNIETHKTFDNITYFKSADIGQMLQVYETEQERREAFAKLRDIPGYNSSPSGLTPPTKNIILRRFLKSRQYEPSEPSIVAQVELELSKIDNTKDTIEIIEEIVQFEDWMVDEAHPDGIVLTLRDNQWSSDTLLVQQHPEMLFREKELADMNAIINSKIEKKDELISTIGASSYIGQFIPLQNVTSVSHHKTHPQISSLKINPELSKGVSPVLQVEQGYFSERDSGNMPSNSNNNNVDIDNQLKSGSSKNHGDSDDEWANQVENDLDI